MNIVSLVKVTKSYDLWSNQLGGFKWTRNVWSTLKANTISWGTGDTKANSHQATPLMVEVDIARLNNA